MTRSNIHAERPHPQRLRTRLPMRELTPTPRARAPQRHRGPRLTQQHNSLTRPPKKKIRPVLQLRNTVGAVIRCAGSSQDFCRGPTRPEPAHLPVHHREPRNRPNRRRGAGIRHRRTTQMFRRRHHQVPHPPQQPRLRPNLRTRPERLRQNVSVNHLPEGFHAEGNIFATYGLLHH